MFPLPYSAYKRSGVEWLGEVPENWDVVPVKRQYFVQLGKMLQSQPNATGDQRVRYLKARNVQWFKVELSRVDLMYASIEEHDQYGVQSGDLLVCEGGEGGRCALVSNMGDTAPYIIQNALHRVRPRTAVSRDDPARNDYLQFVLSAVSSSGWFDALNDKATIAHFTAEKFGALPIPMPVPAEQISIVRFLDHATDQIERYIRTKEKLLALLQEQKQIMIHDAVTGRIDVRTGKPYPAYKPSGIEWLEDVPNHWEILRVKQAAMVLRGKFTHRPRNDPTLYDGPYPFIQTGDVARAAKNITAYKQTLNARGLAVSQLFPAGTLVMTIAANIGDVALLDFEACFPDSVVGLFPRKEVERDYLYRMFQATKSELIREAPVNTQGNLNVDRIGSRTIPLPPLSEQAAITLFLDNTTTNITHAVNNAIREIELLREYRTRLIADVVTGKLDVREAAANLPELEAIAGGGDETIPAEPDSQQSNTTSHPPATPGASS